MNVFVSFVNGYVRVNDVTVELTKNISSGMESICWNETVGLVKCDNETKFLMGYRDFDTYIVPWVKYVNEMLRVETAQII